jgi:hypothetical protein
LLDITDEQLHKVIAAYLAGDNNFTLSGETFYFGQWVSVFKIFENKSGLSKDELKNLQSENGAGSGFFSYTHFTIDQLRGLGVDLTDQLVGDKSFGCNREKAIEENTNFVNSKRIQELVELDGKCPYDLYKLISLCKEINSNYIQHNYYSVTLLLRTVLNHVPPAFNGKESFDQVLSEFQGPKHKTKREILSRIQELQRKLADMVTHERLKKFEPEMTVQQVSFIPEIDYLLQEVISELRKI